jgi:hypothetical protein
VAPPCSKLFCSQEFFPIVNGSVSTVERVPLVLRLGQTLIAAANPTGGWAYYSGKGSRIEATCWALLALADTWGEDTATWQRFAAPHVQWLATLQRGDGLLLDYPTAPPNLTANGLAACLIAHLGTASKSFLPSDDLLTRLVGGIVRVKGVSVNNSDGGQDSRLQGWPWMPDTFSWVEPTCWCMLALKKIRARSGAAGESRIEEAEKLLLNRGCSVGGWNAGNASAMGQDLRPYVPTTALGLIALQDRRGEAVVERSLAYLTQARVTEPSAMALSLTLLCFRIYDRPGDDVEARLAGDVDRAERIGNLQALAMLVYALSATQHGAKALRV